MPHRPLATQHIQEEYHSAIQFEDQENEIVSGQHHHTRPVDRYELPPPQHQVGPRVQRRLDVSQMYPGNNKADQHTRADMRGIHATQRAGLRDLQTCAPSMDRQYIPSQHNGAAPSEIGRLPTGNRVPPAPVGQRHRAEPISSHLHRRQIDQQYIPQPISEQQQRINNYDLPTSVRRSQQSRDYDALSADEQTDIDASHDSSMEQGHIPVQRRA